MKNLYLTLSLLFCLHLLAFSQSDSARLTTIASKLEKLSATHPVEKVYLQFNKPGYNVGDTIWFKGYVTVGTHHQPSALSGVLYADLVDSKDKIIQSLLLKNNNGVSAGDFVLGNKLLPGNYHVRAYTTWMRNAGPGYFFNQTIPVNDVGTDALLISPAYSISAINNEEAVNTKLVYADQSGRPFGRRQVNYEVRADTNLLYRGKGVTDDKGGLSFTFPAKTAPHQQVRLMSHLKLTNDVVIDKTTPLNIINENIDIQFFPEGGQLVNNVRSRVAFKAIGTNGLGVNVTGTIIDNENNEVADFETQHAGMGVFALTPLPGKTYTAKVTIAGNLAVTAKLPAAGDKGFVLAVNNNPGDSTKLNIRVTTNEATLQDKKGQSFYIVGQSGGVVYYTTVGKLDDVSFTAVVPKSNFPGGIAQFTLFSGANEPLNERVAFIQNPNDILDLNLAAKQQIYAPKGKVSLAVTAKDHQNKPVQGSFSLTVYHEDGAPVNGNNESTILSNLLLTSDLAGYIEGPNYYFDNGTAQSKADLDVLMLTQGYRRFEWKEIIGDHFPEITYQPEKGLSLTGRLTYAKDKPVIKGKIGALSVANNIAVNTITDDEGKFMLTGFEGLPDTTTLLVQARTANDKRDVDIKLDSKTYPPLVENANTLASTETTPQLLNEISDTHMQTNTIGVADTARLAVAIKTAAQFKNSGEKVLKEVTIKARKNAGTELAPWIEVNPRSANLNGPGHADMVLTTKDIENCPEFIECVINRLPGIMRKQVSYMISPTGFVYYFSRHVGQSLTKPPAIAYMLDGQTVSLTNLSGLNVNDIATIEVLNSSSYLNIYGSSASGGLIIITTKITSADPNENYTAEVSPGVITTKFKGFTKVEEFYVPKYTAKNINTPDTRDAIYWNPNIITDDKGTFPVEYFNSDIKGIYRVVIEGIDNDGNIGRYVYRYKVE